MPTFLMDGTSLIYGRETVESYTSAMVLAFALCVGCIALSIPIFNKKQL